MELKIKKEHKNPLFKRIEIEGETEHKVTPSFIEMEKIISEKFSTQPAHIKIKKIQGSFGTKKFKIKAFIYDSEKDKTEIEPKQKAKKQ